jgi:methylmalonyl-CoA/ethylmalonyl-CoA epimerase
MEKPVKINHIALAVTDLERSLSFWKDALGLEVEKTEEISAEKAIVSFLNIGDSKIELVQSTDPESGLGKYLEKKGPGIHHICIEVENIEQMVKQLKGKGIRLINEVPREKEDGRRYVFIHPESTQGVLIELYQ